MDPVAAITAVGDALASGFKFFQPYVDEHFAQLYEKEHRDRMGQWGQILSNSDNISRADAINTFVLHLLSSAGTTAGGLSGTSVEVPLDVLNQLVATASLKIKEDSMLAKIQFKENK